METCYNCAFGEYHGEAIPWFGCAKQDTVIEAVWVDSAMAGGEDFECKHWLSIETIPALVAEVERLQHELHDEQVRRNEWENMYNQALLVATAPDDPPRGHPREEADDDD